MNADGGAGSGLNGGDCYRFGPIVVDATAHTLTRDGEPQAIEPKAFAVLLFLLQHAGELVRHNDLLDAVWGHRHVTPGVLTRAIAQLRHALDDDSQHPQYIQTQHGLGYRFVGELLPGPPSDAAQLRDERGHEEGASMVATLPTAAGDTPDTGFSPGETRGDPNGARTGGIGQPVPVDDVGASLRFKPQRMRLLAALAVTTVAVVALWYWRASSVRLADASIAVLPFTSLSNDRGDSYFAEGLAVEMHDALAGIPGLKVAACRADSACGKRQSDVKALGKMLGVATVLDASVRREDQRVRISARLSDTRTGFTLWSGSYDRELNGVFALQREIANEVVSSLGGALPDDGETLRKRLTQTRSVAAFDAYLRGLQQLWHDGGSEDDAIRFFQEALAKDTGFVRAQAGICRAELKRFEGLRNSEAFDNARIACMRAGRMDPTLGEVTLALGDLHRVGGDLDKAVEYYRKIEQDPALRSLALVGLAKVYSAQGQEDVALAYFQRALETKPGDGLIYAEMGYRQYLGGHVQEAIASYRKALELRPDSADDWSTYGGLLLTAGDNAAAAQALERSLEIEPSDAALSNLGTLRYEAGDYAAAADLHRRATELNPGDFIIWGNLGDALLEDPTTAAQSREAYREAASRAQRYVEIKPDDAKALAALGWYRANLEAPVQAKELVQRSEALATEPAEVALFNAETLASLGEIEPARRRVAAARAAGMAESRITTSAVLRRANVISNDAAPDRTGDNRSPL